MHLWVYRIDVRAAGPIDRSTKPPLVSTVVLQSEHTVSPQSVVRHLVNTTKHKTCAVTQLEDYACVKRRHGEDDICQVRRRMSVSENYAITLIEM